MNVTFEIDLPDQMRVSEANIAELPPEDVRLVFGDVLVPVGGLNISDPRGTAFTALGDELESLIGTVCLEAIPELAAGRKVTYAMRDEPVEVQFIPENNNVRIEGGELRSLTYPRPELLKALTDCGERFIKFLEAAHPGDENWASTLQRLTASAARARAALGA